MAWASPILLAAPMKNDREYLGNDQVEYNATAIAALGIVSLFLRDRDNATRDIILRLSGYDHPAVLEALGQNLQRLARLNEQIPRSIARIVMISAVHPRRVLDIARQTENAALHRQTIDTAIEAERCWLGGDGSEPPWPELAPWKSRPRRGIRLGDDGHIEDDETEDEPPSHYVDERAIGRLVHHLISFTIVEVPAWIRDLAGHFMAWSDEANGPHGDDVRDRDNRPDTWNIQFFDFIGVLSVAIPHSEVVDIFLSRILKFNEEAFHDAMASFLRGYDRATVATDTKEPENPAAVRALLADRIKCAWNYRRLGREKGFTSETHAGDALNAMFYQPSRWANNGHYDPCQLARLAGNNGDPDGSCCRGSNFRLFGKPVLELGRIFARQGACSVRGSGYCGVVWRVRYRQKLLGRKEHREPRLHLVRRPSYQRRLSIRCRKERR